MLFFLWLQNSYPFTVKENLPDGQVLCPQPDFSLPAGASADEFRTGVGVRRADRPFLCRSPLCMLRLLFR
ncbi:MAG: hypothetical protein JNK99_04460 [Candidatus Accumulibacter sp.]|uniref:hypothetical protein n=1 Tax=Accumulibacter sp. TaxID=2053492 RepID=UPI001A532C24|nr:hypothetical protein [Accumulibacter sp.]MBL8393992.1 hypothetical protein [Accumulibacter sp.]